MIVAIIAGARPNFMKVAPIIKAIQEARSKDQDIDYRLIHTGQHYDKKNERRLLRTARYT